MLVLVQRLEEEERHHAGVAVIVGEHLHIDRLFERRVGRVDVEPAQIRKVGARRPATPMRRVIVRASVPRSDAVRDCVHQVHLRWIP